MGRRERAERERRARARSARVPLSIALGVFVSLLGDHGSGPSLASAEDVRAAERLVTFAAASARPAPCVKGTTRDTALWQKARFPESSRLCALLLLGSAHLFGDDGRARALAEEASRMAPERAEPLVLLARAELLLGDSKQAAEHFARALVLDGRALDAPLVLLAAARADVLVGDAPGGLESYRKLVSRVPLLSDQRERQKALIEASILSQFVSKESYAEARAYAAEARREGALFFADQARAAMALALDRMGRSAEARAIAAETAGPRALAWLFESEPAPRGRADEVRPVLPPGEDLAMVAILAQSVDRELAKESWTEYIEQAEARSSFPPHLLEHAKRRLRDLGG